MGKQRKFIVLGAGGQGKVVADAIRASGDFVAGFVDNDPEKVGQVVDPGGAEVICSQGDFFELVDAGRMEELGDAVALAIGNNSLRSKLLSRFEPAQIPPVLHPSATLSDSAQIGPGTVVFAGAVINPAAVVGAGVIVNSGAIVEHDCEVGDGVHLSPNAAVCGGTRVGARSWIGAGSTAIHDINIGNDVTVGAGAVIIDDVPDGVTIVGNPGRIIRRK